MSRTQRKQTIDRLLSDVYRTVEIHGETCFCVPNGNIVMIQEMPGENALVMGHAESLTDAEQCRFEDGDRFYLDDMTEKEMLQAMIAEIME